MKNKRMKRYYLATLLAFLFLPLAVAYADDLEVDWEDDPLFEVKNAMPGETYSREFRVENNHEEDFEVFLDIDDDGWSAQERDLASRLFFEVVDAGSRSVFLDDMNLLEAVNEGDMFLETLESNDDGSNDEKNTYEMRLTFDPDAGNEYQNRELKFFDISVRVTGKESSDDDDDDSDEDDDNGSGGGGGGATNSSSLGISSPTGEAIAGVETTNADDEGNGVGSDVTGSSGEGANGGVNGALDENGVISGVEDVCRGWPWWAWAILLAIVAGATNIRRLPVSPVLMKNAVMIQIFSGAGGLAVWYLFETCREFYWFPLGVAIALIVGVFLKIPSDDGV